MVPKVGVEPTGSLLRRVTAASRPLRVYLDTHNDNYHLNKIDCQRTKYARIFLISASGRGHGKLVEKAGIEPASGCVQNIRQSPAKLPHGIWRKGNPGRVSRRGR